MALITKDRVAETSTTTGTGALTLAGALTGYRTFASVMSTSDTCYYLIEAVDSNGVPTGDWETGYGTYSGTNTLTRTAVKASTNSNAAVSFAAGTKRVTISQIASAIRSTSLVGVAVPPVLTDFTQVNVTGSYSVTQYDNGIYIKDASPLTSFALCGISQAVPTAPYRIVIALQHSQPVSINYISYTVGFTDGTKFDLWGQYQSNTQALTTWSNTTTRASSGSLGVEMPYHDVIFFSLEDDNAGTCKIGYSFNGIGPFFALKTITKSSGYLGSSGYTSGFVGLSNYASGGVSGTSYAYGLAVREWDLGGLTRPPIG